MLGFGSRRVGGVLAAIVLAVAVLAVRSAPAAAQARPYSANEIVGAGTAFFGEVSGGIAAVIERAFSTYGQPNGYILGGEAGAALFAGLRYGEGTLYTKNAGTHPVFWQGPSIGWDVGGAGSRTMMLVYSLPDVPAMYQRFAGVNGSAYLVGGIGMTVLAGHGMVVVPIVSGVGLRFGASIGYLKFTPAPTWNPF